MTLQLQELLRTRYAGDFSLGEQLSRTVHAVAGPDGPWLLKLHDEQVLPRAALLEQLYTVVTGAGLAPAMLPDRDGRLLGTMQGRVHSLQRRIAAGQQRPCPLALARKLAELHALLAKKCGGLEIANHFSTDHAALADCAGRHGLEAALPHLEQVAAWLDSQPHQMVHGDLHPGNVLAVGDALFFIDFDSATRLPAGAEAALSAWRCCADPELRRKSLAAYNLVAGTALTPQDMARWLIFHTLQRMHYITAAADQGDERWLYDLPAQQRRCREALTMLRRARPHKSA